MAVLAIEALAWEAATAWDGATLHIKDGEDRATLVERGALELVPWVEAENSTALTSAHDDTEGLVQKITLLESELMEERWDREVSKREHRECLDELTLLQT
jgi:hypothetical protein